MKAIKLTDMEREIYNALVQHEGGCLRQHIKPSNNVCYRLLDARRNPIANYRQGKVLSLADKGVLDIQPNGDYILKATIDKTWG